MKLLFCFCLFTLTFGIELSGQSKTFLTQGCDDRECASQKQACRKDSTCSQVIINCSRNFANDLIEGYQMSSSKTAYALCLKNSKNSKATAVYNCMLQRCFKVLATIENLDSQFEDIDHYKSLESAIQHEEQLYNDNPYED